MEHKHRMTYPKIQRTEKPINHSSKLSKHPANITKPLPNPVKTIMEACEMMYEGDMM